MYFSCSLHKSSKLDSDLKQIQERHKAHTVKPCKRVPSNRIPLVPRRPQSPDPDSKPGTTPGKDKKDKKAAKKGASDDAPGVESPMPPADPDEKLLFDAHYFAISAIGQLVSCWGFTFIS